MKEFQVSDRKITMGCPFSHSEQHSSVTPKTYEIHTNSKGI